MVWDQIVSDFQRAKTLLPEAFDPGIHHPSYEVRANRFAASAMLMRSHFQRGEYDLALNEANFMINQNNGAYDLSEEPIEAWNKIGLGERGMETIWYLNYSDQQIQPPSHLSVMATTYDRLQSSFNQTHMAAGTIERLGWMEDAENDKTFTEKARSDKRFQQLIQVWHPAGTGTGDQVEAQTGRDIINDRLTLWSDKYFRGEDRTMSTNLPLIRLAEVYLTRSILRFKAGNINGAAEDLNIVRQRAWDDSFGAFEPVLTGNLTEEMIHDERIIEMFNEADRLNYLRALKTDVPLGERGEGSEPYTSESFVWIKPIQETDFNPSF
jgi:hypothetical protein